MLTGLEPSWFRKRSPSSSPGAIDPSVRGVQVSRARLSLLSTFSCLSSCGLFGLIWLSQNAQGSTPANAAKATATDARTSTMGCEPHRTLPISSASQHGRHAAARGSPSLQSKSSQSRQAQARLQERLDLVEEIITSLDEHRLELLKANLSRCTWHGRRGLFAASS